MATTHPTQSCSPRPLLGRLSRVVVTGAAAAALSVGVLPGVASAQTAAPAAATAAVAATPSPVAQAAAETALAEVGKGYAYGGNGPASFDCSGLTTAAFAAHGVALPRTSSAQAQVGHFVSRADLIPGDLVFYYSPVSHVGVYVGNGQIVNALNSSTGVTVSNVDMAGYTTARRVA